MDNNTYVVLAEKVDNISYYFVAIYDFYLEAEYGKYELINIGLTFREAAELAKEYTNELRLLISNGARV